MSQLMSLVLFNKFLYEIYNFFSSSFLSYSSYCCRHFSKEKNEEEEEEDEDEGIDEGQAKKMINV